VCSLSLSLSLSFLVLFYQETSGKARFGTINKRLSLSLLSDLMFILIEGKEPSLLLIVALIMSDLIEISNRVNR